MPENPYNIIIMGELEGLHDSVFCFLLFIFLGGEVLTTKGRISVQSHNDGKAFSDGPVEEQK